MDQISARNQGHETKLCIIWNYFEYCKLEHHVSLGRIDRTDGFP